MSRILEVSDLEIELELDGSTISPVRGASITVDRGEILGIAGESGSGKSLTLKSLIGLLPRHGMAKGTLLFSQDGGEPSPYDPADVRGRGISMVFQEPMTALNPTMRVGDLISIGPRFHEGLSRRQAKARTLDLMERVGLPDAERRAKMWPHELSGGLRQRVMIAVALSTKPELLLCDEPTTALDVSVQDQILGLLQQLRTDLGMAIVFVSHDLAVIGELCDRVAVMYAGRVLETGPTTDLLSDPRHPYTAGLIASIPSFDRLDIEPRGIPGQPPDPAVESSGCPFADRCAFTKDDCRTTPFHLTGTRDRQTACIHPEVLRDGRPA